MVRMSKSPTIAASTCLRYEVFRFDPMGTGMPIVAIASLLPFHPGHLGEFMPIPAPWKPLPDSSFQKTTQVRRLRPRRAAEDPPTGAVTGTTPVITGKVPADKGNCHRRTHVVTIPRNLAVRRGNRGRIEKAPEAHPKAFAMPSHLSGR
ncbi:hypothetical protein GCM10022223_08930 [Kineosporia mesophila]|uniref:Uncharacterized protein n=1 Tax=Kineosporia mesophila TaxID=566012 RepID=A0ABP6Z6L2_9ACTN